MLTSQSPHVAFCLTYGLKQQPRITTFGSPLMLVDTPIKPTITLRCWLSSEFVSVKDVTP